MVEHNDFEDTIRNLTNNSTLNRANLISDDCIRIIEMNKEIGIIKAEIQGNKVIPYKLNLNISQENLYDVIYHDCPDYLLHFGRSIHFSGCHRDRMNFEIV